MYRLVSILARFRFFSRMRTLWAAKSTSSTCDRTISLRRAPVWATNTNIG